MLRVTCRLPKEHSFNAAIPHLLLLHLRPPSHLCRYRSHLLLLTLPFPLPGQVEERALQALTFVSHRYGYWSHNFLALLFGERAPQLRVTDSCCAHGYCCQRV